MLKEESYQEKKFKYLDENLVHSSHVYTLLKNQGLKESALLKISSKNWLPLSFSIQHSQSYNLKNSEEKLNTNLVKEGKSQLIIAVLLRLYSPYLSEKKQKNLFEKDLLEWLEEDNENKKNALFKRATQPQGISYCLPPLKYFTTQKPYEGTYRICFYQAPYNLASAIFDKDFPKLLEVLEHYVDKHFQEKGPKFSHDMRRELKMLNLPPDLLAILSTNKNAHKATTSNEYLIEDKKKGLYAIFLDYHETQ